jgi:hypothetical protein
MSLKSKCELVEVLQAWYLKASKAEKQKMLDEFTLAAGYHRKHATGTRSARVFLMSI